MPLEWSDTITDNPALDAIEIWVLHNFTHPSTFMRCSSRSWTAAVRSPVARARALGTRLQGHGHRLPWRDHP